MERPILLYSLEHWPLERRKSRSRWAQRWGFRYICGWLGLDKIKKEFIADRVGVTHIEDNLKEVKLK